MGASLLGNIETANYIHKLTFFMYTIIFGSIKFVYENFGTLQWYSTETWTYHGDTYS
jgi:hypothetical protein